MNKRINLVNLTIFCFDKKKKNKYCVLSLGKMYTL